MMVGTLYMLWAVFGLLILDLLFGLFKSVVTKSFSPNIILSAVKDILFYVYPLVFVINMLSVDPTGWILLIFYYVGSIGVILHYLVSIKNKWSA
jgi:hypothetical protein